MEYRFVFDDNIIDKLGFYLSRREMQVVMAVVQGKHNAVFFGYKPERLVSAIHKFIKNSEDIPQIFAVKSLSDLDVETQKNCSIIFECKDDCFNEKIIWGHGKVNYYLEQARTQKSSRGETKSNEELGFSWVFDVSSSASDNLSSMYSAHPSLTAYNSVIRKVARSVGDLNGHIRIFSSDIDMAKDFCGLLPKITNR